MNSNLAEWRSQGAETVAPELLSLHRCGRCLGSVPSPPGGFPDFYTEPFRVEKSFKIRKSNHQIDLLSPIVKPYPSVSHSHTSLRYIQGCGLHHLSEQPLPMPDHPLHEESVSNTQLKPSQCNLRPSFHIPFPVTYEKRLLTYPYNQIEIPQSNPASPQKTQR